MHVLYDDLFDYPAVGPSRCHLKVLQGGNHAVVIATQRSLTDGTSITNAAEIMATLVALQFQLDPARCLFVEHYPKGMLRPSRLSPEKEEGRYKLVTFT